MVTQLMFHSWGMWHSKPGNQGFRRTVGETGGNGWGECVCRQVRELYPKDLQDGHWGGPLSQVTSWSGGLHKHRNKLCRGGVCFLRLVVTSLEL